MSDGTMIYVRPTRTRVSRTTRAPTGVRPPFT